MKARKKPIEVECIQWTGNNENEIMNFCGRNAYYLCGFTYENNNWELYIKTLEGDMKADPGDYIIKGVHGEYYPCKPDIFAETYEVIAE